MTDQRWFDESDELDDNEYPDEDLEDDDLSETLPCPECGAEVYEDSERCPHCGHYITTGSGSLWAGRPAWWVLLGLLGIVAVVFALIVLAGP